MWDSAAHAALPAKTPSLSLGHVSAPRNHHYALLQGGVHLEAMLAFPHCFFVFIVVLAPPVLLSMAAFLRHSIRGCLPKSRTTHSPRDVVISGLFLSSGTEVASRLPGAGTRNMPLLTASPAAPVVVWPSAVCCYMAEAKAAEAPIYLLFPAHPTGYPVDLDVGPLEQLQHPYLL